MLITNLNVMMMMLMKKNEQNAGNIQLIDPNFKQSHCVYCIISFFILLVRAHSIGNDTLSHVNYVNDNNKLCMIIVQHQIV